ncbi:MAG: hypothetical protein ACOCUV_03260, partial [bacterium]
MNTKLLNDHNAKDQRDRSLTHISILRSAFRVLRSGFCVLRSQLLLLSVLVLLSPALSAQQLSPVWPKFDQVMPSADIEFLWNEHNEAVSYNIEIYSDEELVSLIEADNVVGNSYLWEAPAPGEYFWRVQA